MKAKIYHVKKYSRIYFPIPKLKLTVGNASWRKIFAKKYVFAKLRKIFVYYQYIVSVIYM